MSATLHRLRQGVSGYQKHLAESFKEKCEATPRKMGIPLVIHVGEAICKIPERNFIWVFLKRTFVMARKGKPDRRGRKLETA
jgi:hypothetical protein